MKKYRGNLMYTGGGTQIAYKYYTISIQDVNTLILCYSVPTLPTDECFLTAKAVPRPILDAFTHSKKNTTAFTRDGQRVERDHKMFRTGDLIREDTQGIVCVCLASLRDWPSRSHRE